MGFDLAGVLPVECSFRKELFGSGVENGAFSQCAVVDAAFADGPLLLAWHGNREPSPRGS